MMWARPKLETGHRTCLTSETVPRALLFLFLVSSPHDNSPVMNMDEHVAMNDPLDWTVDQVVTYLCHSPLMHHAIAAICSV